MTADPLPYPPPPKQVPGGLTEFPEAYRKKQTTLLVCLVAFLVFYLALTFAAAAGVLVGVLLIGKLKVVALMLAAVSGFALLLLVKGLFHTSAPDRELHIELTEKEHPKLFAFIRRLCEEVGVDEPNAVYAAADVNAAVITRTTLVNVVVPPKQDLLVGLGLVNGVNLSEFKAVLGHEFGHFSQGGFVNSYFGVVWRVCHGIVCGRSWIDRLIDDLRRSDNALGVMVGTVLWAPLAAFRFVLDQLFGLLSRLRTDVMREGEFHADLVAASVAGSDAVTHTLYRCELASECYGRALFELSKAADHKMYTADIWYHQSAVTDLIRKEKVRMKEEYKDRPDLALGADGRKLRVFDAKTSYDPSAEGDYHPSNADREENVKKRFVAAAEDGRSPWALFDKPARLRELMTWRMYRQGLKIKRTATLKDPQAVQAFIDREHEETTYDEKYGGAYDDRLIAPGDLELLDVEARDHPWDDAKLITVHGKLYVEIEAEVEHRRKLLKKLEKARGRTDLTRRSAKKAIREIEDDLEEATKWFATVDRKAYLMAVQMADRLDDGRRGELKHRYAFHLSVQRIYSATGEHYDRSAFMLRALSDLEARRAPPEERNECVSEALEVLKDARRALKRILADASEIAMPEMVKFTDGRPLSRFLLEEPLVKEAYEFGVSGKWLDKLFRQLGQVRARTHRLHFKSLGGILALQEAIAKDFLASRMNHTV